MRGKRSLISLSTHWLYHPYTQRKLPSVVVHLLRDQFPHQPTPFPHTPPLTSSFVHSLILPFPSTYHFPLSSLNEGTYYILQEYKRKEHKGMFNKRKEHKEHKGVFNKRKEHSEHKGMFNKRKEHKGLSNKRKEHKGVSNKRKEQKTQKGCLTKEKNTKGCPTK